MPYDSRTILNRIKTVPQVSLNCNDYNIKRQSDNTAAQRSDVGSQFALPRERKIIAPVGRLPDCKRPIRAKGATIAQRAIFPAQRAAPPSIRAGEAAGFSRRISGRYALRDSPPPKQSNRVAFAPTPAPEPRERAPRPLGEDFFPSGRSPRRPAPIARGKPPALADGQTLQSQWSFAVRKTFEPRFARLGRNVILSDNGNSTRIGCLGEGAVA